MSKKLLFFLLVKHVESNLQSALHSKSSSSLSLSPEHGNFIQSFLYWSLQIVIGRVEHETLQRKHSIVFIMWKFSRSRESEKSWNNFEKLELNFGWKFVAWWNFEFSETDIMNKPVKLLMKNLLSSSTHLAAERKKETGQKIILWKGAWLRKVFPLSLPATSPKLTRVLG